MAVITLENKRQEVVDPMIARELWFVLNEEKPGTKEQRAYCKNVVAVNLNWRNAPNSWLQAHAPSVSEVVRGEWMVQGLDGYGHRTTTTKPTRPEPSDKDNRRVSRLLGML